MECYNDFAVIYDELISEDINYEQWSSSIIDICDKYKVEKRNYLDLACGTGNLTAEIGKNFMFTTAVDLSPSMLSIADEKIKEKKIRGRVACQDICNLKLDKKFDLITCGLDSTNYILEEDSLKGYFEGVYNHLKDNGIFIFDVNTEYKIKEVLGNNTYNYDNGDVLYIWENNLEGDVVTMELTFFVKEGQVYRRIDETHRERCYSDEKLIGYSKGVGFEIVEKLNSYGDSPIDSYCERITYVLRKDVK